MGGECLSMGAESKYVCEGKLIYECRNSKFVV